jgi:uncharacterized cupin superfamily protein
MTERQPVPEATLADTEHGRTPTSDGWFVVNLTDAFGFRNPSSGAVLPLEGDDHRFPGVGINVHLLEPGQQSCRYHEEDAQEGFLVLHGACLLLVEEQERELRQWDFFHCPGGTRHVFVGAGEGLCAILMIGARPAEERIHYPVSEVAAGHGASVTEATDVPDEAYADWPGPWQPGRPLWPPR